MIRGNWMRDQLSQTVGCFFLLLLLQTKPGDAADAASDNILVGAYLTGNETRISKSGIFKLGFFNLNNDTVKNWYVGIWYATGSQKTIAWVANREQPMQNASGVLNLTEDGSLLLSYVGSIIWSSKGNGKKPSSAVITDSGNLAVLSAENSSESIWQSFDQPGNTWLPGMTMSMKQRLTSWRKPWDPSPGPFSLEIYPNGDNQFVLVWENHTRYWDNGVWNGKYYSKTPEMSSNSLNSYSYFNNGSYQSFTFSYAKQGLTYLSRLVMDKSGEMRVYIMPGNEWSLIWQQPVVQCDVYAVCGPYGSCNNNNVQSCMCVRGFVPKDSREWESQQWTSGCVRKTPLQCSHSSNRTTTNGFLELSGKSTPPEGIPYKGQEQCQEACLGNCSCTAYAYVLNGTSQTCVMWFGELLNLYDSSNGISLFLRLDASDVPDSSNSKKKATDLTGLVGGVVGGLVAILAFVILFLWCRKRSLSSATEYEPGTLIVFTYRELQRATKNFSEWLGGGGFGSVFKGTLTDGSMVAVKKLEGVSQGEKQFRMEVSSSGNTQHVNLVRLRGFCTEGSRRLLVYEYMPNGSLSSVLFHKTRGDDQIQEKVLDWKTRFGIAVGTARGIVYLHEKCRDCIIHCDIKPENILLDSNFCPKVADFGLAKFLGREYSRALTTMRGTRGYLGPEWLSGLPITAKADVYSFGMTLLEIIAGRRNMDEGSESSELFFPAWAATQINRGNAMEVLDKKLINDADAEQVKRAAIVGGWCIQDDEDARPSMSEVLQILEGLVDVPPLPPLPFSLQNLALKANSLVFFWDKDSASAHNNNSDNPSTML